MTRAELKTLGKEFDWDRYFAEVGTPTVDALDVKHPPYATTVSTVVRETSPKQLRTYLAWAFVRSRVLALPKRFSDATFAFQSRYLSGAKEDLPRWKKCVAATDVALGEALAVPFVQRTFGEEGKRTTKAMVKAIVRAFEANLDGLTWMDAGTKDRARYKAHKLDQKIGYPDRWRSYDQLTTDRKSFLANLMSASAFETARDLAEDRQAARPHRVADDAADGERLLHVLAQRDGVPRGHPPAPHVLARGHRRGELRRRRDGHRPRADPRLRRPGPALRRRREPHRLVVTRCGKGFRRARRLREDPVRRVRRGGRPAPQRRPHRQRERRRPRRAQDRLRRDAGLVEGAPKRVARDARFTPEQQFFLGAGQAWCRNVRPEELRRRVTVDPHSPARFRIDGPFSNMPQFQSAFGCSAGTPMVRQTRCEVW